MTGGDQKPHAFLWDNGNFKDLHPSGVDAATSKADAIGNSGRVIGSFTATNGQTFACTWFDGTFNILHPQQATASLAKALNDAGTIIGSFTREGADHAFKWTGGNFVTDLTPPNAKSSEAEAINAAGQIAGSYVDGAGIQHAAVWGDAIYADLAPPGAVESRAEVISASGQIAGTYKTATGLIRLFLLTPAEAPPDIHPTYPPPPPPLLSVKGKRKFKTAKASVTLRGSASGTVSAVSYHVGKGPEKFASGSQSWQFKAKLKKGKNAVSITARGPGGNSAAAVVTIFRQ